MDNIQNSQNQKKEYDLKREQKERERDKRERKKAILRVFRWIAIVVGMFLLIVFLVKLAAPKPGSGDLTQADALSEGDWVWGNREAKVVLLEYSDFQCPACASYYPILKQIKTEYADRLAFTYRHFPLRSIHDNARPAAVAAEAAGRQGKFWEMHDALFDNQRSWSNLGDPMAEFSKYAESIGLDVEQFKRDADSSELKNKVDSDYDGGTRAKVNSTPTFFINGTKIENPRGYDDFKNILDQVFQITGQ